MSGYQGSFTAQWRPTLDDPTLELTVSKYDKSTYTKRDKTKLHVQECRLTVESCQQPVNINA